MKSTTAYTLTKSLYDAVNGALSDGGRKGLTYRYGSEGYTDFYGSIAEVHRRVGLPFDYCAGGAQ